LVTASCFHVPFATLQLQKWLNCHQWQQQHGKHDALCCSAAAKMAELPPVVAATRPAVEYNCFEYNFFVLWSM
jgi:hypothetical protein